MKSIIIYLGYFLLPYLALAQQSPISQIDTLMEAAHHRGIFNGNILIYHHGIKIYERSFGFADIEKKLPLTSAMKFDIGSISKEFNAVGIMVLKEKGKLSLEDSLAKYYPSFPQWANQVKIRHLLNYTSGIPILGPQSDGNDTLILKSLDTLKRLVAEPGSTYIYNHINVSLQRSIIEKVSGLSYSTFVSQYLLTPLGMNNSSVDLPVESRSMARAYDGIGKNVRYEQATKGWVRLPAHDLYKWIMGLTENRLITSNSLRELGKNFPGGESSLGTTEFDADKLLFHQHQGSNSNYEAAFYQHTGEEVVIVMMTNHQQMKVWPLKTAIVNILLNRPYTVPKKSLYLSIRDRMLDNFDDGMKLYQKLKTNDREVYDFSFEVGDLISTGKYLQRRNKFMEALKIYGEAVKLDYPPRDISYGYELIAECYVKLHDKANALANYRQAVKLNPDNKNAAGMITSLIKE